MTRRLFLILGLVCFVGPALAVEPPRCVLLIRHAEKPEREDMAVHLTAVGKKRAELLPELFVKSDQRPDPFPRPDFLFAAANSKSSHRSVETTTPLAEKMKMKLHAEIKNEDFGRLAKEILGEAKFSGKTVLIAWHHGKIPEFARALGATDAPPTWSGKSFDRVWEIAYGPAGKVTFRDRPQALLPEDSR
jgi:broad specificity phosphatase PhoE